MRETYWKETYIFLRTMKELDVARINQTAPYKVFATERYHYYGFETKTGVILYVGFDEDDLLTAESYQFVVLNGNNKPSPRDESVKNTIFAIIKEFFRENNAVMLYICETGDGRQAERSRLFSHWFSTFSDKGKYSVLQSSIVDSENVENYFAIILRNDNPNLQQVITEFTNAVNFFSHKPD